jgi:hypothetical protein
MSSYADLLIDGATVFRWRNELDHSVLSLFSKDDIVRMRGKRAHQRAQRLGLGGFHAHYGDLGDEYELVAFSRTTKEIKDRLSVLGYGEESFEAFLEGVTEYYGSSRGVFERLLSQYKANKPLDDDCQRELADLLQLNPCDCMFYHLRGADDGASVVLDVSEFAHEGWYDDAYFDEDNGFRGIERTYSPPIILTEGHFDAEVLRGAIALLYPHLLSHVRFLDYNYKPEGGAGVLVKTLKSFAAAGISNRILAVFDNDSAAYDALSSLDQAQLPRNFAVINYPSIEIGNHYPTLGPQGKVDMDINGLAGAIELYLGQDVLREEDGELCPVQWTGYVAKLRRYQGEIISKSAIQARFRAKLKSAEADPKLIRRQDWSGLRLIIEGIIGRLASL